VFVSKNNFLMKQFLFLCTKQKNSAIKKKRLIEGIKKILQKKIKFFD